jgi:hypothetical protein
MQVEFRLYWDDYNAFRRYHTGKGHSWFTFLTGWLAFAAMAVATTYTWADTRTWIPWVFLALTGVYAWVSFELWRHRRRIARDLDQRFEKGNAKLNLAPDGLYVIDPNSQSFTAWGGVLRIVETPTHAFFYTSLEEAIIIPGRAFPSTIDFRTFVGLARKYKDSPPAPEPTHGPPDAIARTSDFTP